MTRPISALLALALVACASKPEVKPEPPPAPAPPPKPVVTAPPPIDLTKPPEAGPTPDFKLPPIVRFKLANGLDVALAERHELPVVAMNLLVLGAGTAADPKDLPGLANFSIGTMDEGAGGRSAQQLALDIERLGASVGSGAGTDAGFVSASGLKRVLDPLLAIFADVSLRPDFPAADVKRVQGELLSSVLRERDQGPVMARLIFGEQLFGTHPYGQRARGTQASLNKMDRNALVSFYKTHFVPERALLVVSGDVTKDEIAPALEKTFGAWKAAEKPAAVDLANPQPPAATTISLFDRPGAAQSSILVGGLGLERTSPDYIPAQVMNAIFGGLFNSRLNMNLREAKHWSYGARASFDARRVPGSVIAGAEVQSDHTAEAIAEILKEIKNMRDTLPTPAELDAAKNSLVRSLPQRFETTGGTAGALGEVMLFGLPANYWETYPEKVQAVTAEQVQQMAQKYLGTEKMTIVVAGDLASIGAPVKALALAPEVVVRDAEGKPVVGK